PPQLRCLLLPGSKARPGAGHRPVQGLLGSLDALLWRGLRHFLFGPARASGSGREVHVMNDGEIPRQPEAIPSIVSDTEKMSFDMISEARVGAFLAALAASKASGRLLELGTGTGHG